MIRILARFRCDASHSADVETILRGMVTPTRAETGCLRYDLYRLEDGFLLDEAYADDAGVRAHRESKHYFAYREAISPRLSAPIEVMTPKSLDAA